MTDFITEKEAIIMLAGLFNLAPESLTTSTTKREIKEWDSLGVLMLMAEYDNRFGIIFTQDELESFNCIGDLIQVLKNHHKIVGE